jgi:uncharacterized membrane protein YfcA
MAFASFPVIEMRPTALFLNIVAAGYATWRLHQSAAIDRSMLVRVTVPSLVTAFVGGLLVINGRAYFILTGLLLVGAAALMAFKRMADNVQARPIQLLRATAVGAVAGFMSGLTGVGGGVFLTPLLIALGWMSPRRAAALSPPFILCNSAMGLLGVLLAGQELAPGTVLYSLGALAGAVVGSTIGQRWMTERATRFALVVILLFAGIRLLFR